MKRVLYFSFAVMAMASIASLTTSAAKSGAAAKIGDKPKFSILTMDNKRATSEDFKGRILILEFWATWCGPCKAELPHLKKINEEYGPKGVMLVSVSIDDNKAAADQFTKANGMIWTQLWDKNQPQSLATMFGANSIPHAVIFSTEGQVLWIGHPAGIDKPLEKALADHPPTKGVK